MKNFIIDVDGCLTTGQFLYSARGKVMKIYGPDDADALSILKNKIYIHMISGDKRGFSITKRRVVNDMDFPLDLVNTFERIEWMEKGFNLKETIYMGDGILDGLVFEKVGYSIAPANAFFITKQKANFVTQSKGGEGAVAEACIHIFKKFLGGFNLHSIDFTKGSGIWKKAV